MEWSGLHEMMDELIDGWMVHGSAGQRAHQREGGSADVFALAND